MPLEELYKANTEKFAAVYPDKGRNSAEVMTSAPAPKTFVYPGEAVETPVVYIPVFPGTNCDYDTAKAFRAAGAEVRTSAGRTSSCSQAVSRRATNPTEAPNSLSMC